MRPCLKGRAAIVRDRVPLGLSYPLSSVNPLEGLTFYHDYYVLSRVCVNRRRES